MGYLDRLLDLLHSELTDRSTMGKALNDICNHW